MNALLEHQKTAALSSVLRWIVAGLMAQAVTAFGLTFNVSLSSLTNHNTSAYAAYNETNFGANFGATTWVNQNGATLPVDPTQMDESLNPKTPGHVSKMDVHTLIPSRPDLRWFAHATPWFGTSSHINIGLTNNTTTYVAAMITDMKNRGFNGVVMDWYGLTDSTDGVAQKVKTYLSGLTSNTFTYIIMMDSGVDGGTSLTNLQAQVRYCQSQYFNDPNYERDPLTNGLPILMFFNMRNTIGVGNMTILKDSTGNNMVWVEQGTSYLSESWENECFEWTDEYDTGVNYTDPFNLTGVTNDFSAILQSGKKAFGAMCARFNGTLTKKVSWSLGKYLPCSNGLCEVERAALINTAIPANMTRMQWPTWSDWEEGTQVESGIENDFALSTQVSASNVLSWTITSGYESTVDHYEIYASLNGAVAADLGSVPTGLYQTNLSNAGLPAGTCQLYVDAVGKPCIRDHLSLPVSLAVTNSSGPVVQTNIQPLSQIVWQGDPVSFSVVAGGASPLSYQWILNSQNIAGATNSVYSFAALAGTNYYQVSISNSDGTATSSTGEVVGLPATFLNASNYNGMKITFSGYTNGVSLLDFPVLVRLSTNIPGFSYAQFVSPSNGADLRFAAANGRELPFQIDQWNPAGESQVWVQAPSITTTNDSITAYWGNTADSVMPASNTNGAVWTTLSGLNNYLLVYHLSQSGFPYVDSTLNYPAISGVAPVLTNGVVGNGCAFNGTSQFLDAGLVNSGKTFTLSAWVNIAPAATSEQTIWCNKQGGWNTAGFDFYVNSWETNDGIIYFDSADGVNGNVSPRTLAHAFPFGQWHYLAGTMDGVNGAVQVYVDGTNQTINSGVDTAFQVTNYVRLGSLLTGTPGAMGSTCFEGAMDEVRIQSGVSSPAWVWASWATVADSTFAAFGSIIPAATTLQCQRLNGQIVLTWTTGALQSASAVNGPYTDITGASNPYLFVPSKTQEYFRVRVQF